MRSVILYVATLRSHERTTYADFGFSSNYSARDTKRLGATIDVEQSAVRFLGSLVLVGRSSLYMKTSMAECVESVGLRRAECFHRQLFDCPKRHHLHECRRPHLRVRHHLDGVGVGLEVFRGHYRCFTREFERRGSVGVDQQDGSGRQGGSSEEEVCREEGGDPGRGREGFSREGEKGAVASIRNDNMGRVALQGDSKAGPTT